MVSLAWLLLVAAIVCFAIPAIKALFNGQFDFTNTGLALFVLYFLIGRGG